MKKTNVMRILEKEKIPYQVLEYIVDEEDLSGVHAAKETGEPVEKMYKTLVCKGEKKGYLVFCIPVHLELDLKKGAKAAGDKKIEMLPLKDLLSVTGYMRGGCSPVGMKKKYPVFLHEDAQNQEEIAVSAGVRGESVVIKPKELQKITEAVFCSLTKEL